MWCLCVSHITIFEDLQYPFPTCQFGNLFYNKNPGKVQPSRRITMVAGRGMKTRCCTCGSTLPSATSPSLPTSPTAGGQDFESPVLHYNCVYLEPICYVSLILITATQLPHCRHICNECLIPGFHPNIYMFRIFVQDRCQNFVNLCTSFNAEPYQNPRGRSGGKTRSTSTSYSSWARTTSPSTASSFPPRSSARASPGP